MAPKVQPTQQPTRRSSRQPLPEFGLDERVASKVPQKTNGDLQSLNIESLKVSAEMVPQDSLSYETSSSGQSTSNAPSTSSPVRRPVQRLDSLKRRNVPTASSSSIAGGGPGSRSTGLKFQPKAVIRRTKEEREAQERAEEEKRQARFAANPTLNSGKSRGQYVRGGMADGPTRGGFQGGMSGWRTERRGLCQATGPLSGGPTNNQFASRGGKGGRNGVIISGSMHTEFPRPTLLAPSKVKKEPTVKAEKDQSTATIGLRMPSKTTKETKLKVENLTATYISSDAEVDELEGSRINVEHINLISDEDSGDDSVTTKGKERERSSRPVGWNLKPIRLDRHEHVERHVGINTGAGTMTSAQLRQKANERSQAEGALFLSQDEDDEVVKTKPKKFKSKGKDVEFVRNERRWKGVYQDDEDTYEFKKVKEEPLEDDVMAVDITRTMATDGEGVLTARQELSPSTAIRSLSGGPEEDKEADSLKTKRLRRSIFRTTKPVLQTEEDRQEWERYEDDITALGEELGDLDTALAPVSALSYLEDDVNMSVDEEEKEDRRQGLVYLFQLPPIMPYLINAKMATEDHGMLEHGASTVLSENTQDSLPSAPAVKRIEPVLKMDDTSHKQTHRRIADVLMAEDIDDFKGSVGKLSIHDSGYISISWGDIEHELNKGAEGELLQELIISDVSRIKRELGSIDEDEGKLIKTGTAMGQMTGGFVVTPNWTSLFEG